MLLRLRSAPSPSKCPTSPPPKPSTRPHSVWEPSAPPPVGRALDRLSWVHAVARRVPAGHGRRALRWRPPRRRDGDQARQERALGLWRRRTCSRRDDLEGRDVVEEEHGPDHPADRRHRALVGSRGRRREQAVLRRAGARGGEELRSKVRRVRRPAVADQAGALRAPCPGQGRRSPPRRAPDRTGSSSPARPGPAPTRTVSSGKPRRRQHEASGVVCGVRAAS